MMYKTIIKFKDGFEKVVETKGKVRVSQEDVSYYVSDEGEGTVFVANCEVVESIALNTKDSIPSVEVKVDETKPMVEKMTEEVNGVISQSLDGLFLAIDEIDSRLTALESESTDERELYDFDTANAINIGVPSISPQDELESNVEIKEDGIHVKGPNITFSGEVEETDKSEYDTVEVGGVEDLPDDVQNEFKLGKYKESSTDQANKEIDDAIMSQHFEGLELAIAELDGRFKAFKDKMAEQFQSNHRFLSDRMGLLFNVLEGRVSVLEDDSEEELVYDLDEAAKFIKAKLVLRNESF